MGSSISGHPGPSLASLIDESFLLAAPYLPSDASGQRSNSAYFRGHGSVMVAVVNRVRGPWPEPRKALISFQILVELGRMDLY